MTVERQIFQAAEMARARTGEIAGQPVDPDSSYCFNVAFEFLQVFTGNTLQSMSNSLRIGSISLEHCFLSGKGLEDKFLIVDAAYQQFVSEEQKQGLPPVMIARFDHQKELKQILIQHCISEEFHSFWLNLFPS